jgi:hypothetical protein
VLPVLIAVAILFVLLFVGRVGGARRYDLMRRWPAVLFAGAAIVAVARGAIWPAIAFAAIAALAWTWWPSIARSFVKPVQQGAAPDPADAEARAILGVGATATSSEIRTAYRSKMARAHPDRGGEHAEAARLTAARDRLLSKKR